jgi:hypothetical protein
MTKVSDLPVVLCEQVGSQWSFWCPFCKRRHWHSAEPGHRVAHCGHERLDRSGRVVKDYSPFYESGYVLKLDPRKRRGRP